MDRKETNNQRNRDFSRANFQKTNRTKASIPYEFQLFTRQFINMNTNRSNTLLLLFIVTTIFTACNKKQNIKPNISPQWNNIPTWSFSGKMAISDGKNSDSGRIIWEAIENSTHVKLKALVGLRSWSIDENPDHATLQSSKNNKTIADNAELLISNELGWHFPWNSLKYWVRGYQNQQALTPHDTLPKSFSDNGWEMTFQKWMKTPIGMLPKKIKATKDNYSVKLIVYKWNILPQ